MKKVNYLIICIAISLFSVNATAQDHNEEHADHHSEKSHDEEPTHGDHHVYKHHLALFGGMTTNLTHEVDMPTFGLDYEYRLPFAHQKFGIGLNAEYLAGDNPEKLVGIPIFYHPVGGLKFVAAAMLAMFEEHSAGGHDAHATVEPTTVNELGFRIGTAYDFHINQFSVSPTVNLDFIGESTAIAYGIALGVGF